MQYGTDVVVVVCPDSTGGVGIYYLIGDKQHQNESAGIRSTSVIKQNNGMH